MKFVEVGGSIGFILVIIGLTILMVGSWLTFDWRIMGTGIIILCGAGVVIWLFKKGEKKFGLK